MKKKVSIVLGTRPEAIKLCPVILELRKHPQLEPHICVTAQHREMLDQVLEVFSIWPDTDLNLMEENQSLASLSSRSITALDIYFKKEKPSLVIVQGDTTTTFIASLSAFYNKIPVGHVEAGLRTSNKYSPFPEEINRVLTSHIANLHFAPTETARQNLLKEGIAAERIFVTGNTVIDALLFAVEKVRAHPPEIPEFHPRLMDPKNHRKFVLITGHRRESFGPGFESICKAIRALSEQFPEKMFVYPVHLNPNVRDPVLRFLSGRENILLTEPLSYLPFIYLMDRCTLILTDSGGIQEEAPSLGKPVLIMRDTTERPEALEVGSGKLVGTDSKAIIEEVARLLTDRDAYKKMSKARYLYGDGHAAERIVEACIKFLSKCQTIA